MGRVRSALPRKTIWMDNRGRVTIPADLRKFVDGLEEGWVVVELYPNAENPKSINVRPNK